jgi:hypothetical protein
MNKSQVKQYMLEEIEEFRDPQTGEVNTTFLAEDACNFFDGYEPPPDFDIPEEYFDWALEVDESMNTLGGVS